MWLLVSEEEEGSVFQPELSAFAKSRQRQWSTEIAAGIEVTIQRSRQAGFVVEEGTAVQRLVAQEVVSRAGVVLTTAFGNDVDDRAAVVAILGAVVIAQNLYFGDGVLVDRHAQLV